MATNPTAATGGGLLEQLRQDHLKVDELFARYADAEGDAAKLAIVQQIYLELIPHATAEEEIFYPALRDAGDAEVDDDVAEAYNEHAAAKKTLEAILRGEPDDMTYDLKVKMLQKAIQHHVREEETALFQEARDLGLDLAALDKRVLARKMELKQMLQGDLSAGRVPGVARS
jgi:hemerythrin superfamily protein